VGGVAGAILDRHNPWRGGVIGAAIGAVAGWTLTEISERTEYVVLEMDTEEPHHFHSEINRRYPPGHAKKSHKPQKGWDDD
jgi:hypothetical protein